MADDDTIESLRNLGPVSQQWLREAGIATRAQLEELGAVAAYRRIALLQNGVSLNLLYALQAALLDLDWRELPEEVRAELRAAVDND